MFSVAGAVAAKVLRRAHRAGSRVVLLQVQLRGVEHCQGTKLLVCVYVCLCVVQVQLRGVEYCQGT